MPCTLADILSLEELHDVELRAGVSGLRRKVCHVNVIDAPDIFPWAKEGEIMLTTGYCFRESEEVQQQILTDLARKNCAALGIKTKRYLEIIPPAMLQLANELEFPLLELPFNRSLSDIATPIYRQLLSHHAVKLERSLKTHRHFTRVVLNGGGLEEIAETVRELLEQPVAVLDAGGRVRYLSEGFQGPGSGSLAPGMLFPGMEEKASLSGDSGEEFPVWQIPHAWLVPVVAGEDNLGYLVTARVRRSLRETDRLALEHASTVLALEILKEKAVKEVRRRLRSDFFDSLLNGEIPSEDELVHLAAGYGLVANASYICLVVALENFSPFPQEDRTEKDRRLWERARGLSGMLEKEALNQGTSAVTVARGNRIIALFRIPEAAAAGARELLKGIAASVLDTDPELEVLIGIGGLCRGLVQVHHSFRQANDALKFLRRLGQGRVAAFEDFSVYHLLSSAISRQRLEEFYQLTLAPLAAYDREKGADLVETLEEYINSRGNISHAAKKLYIHRNTLLYRLAKIKEISGTDLENAEELLGLQLALKVKHLLYPVSP